MKVPRLPLSFLVLIIAGLLFTLWLHLLWQDSQGMDRWTDMLALSYAVNFILASGIFLILFVLRKKYKNQIGFLYMAGSLLKFLVFFILFYPGYRADGTVTKSEFAAFFIPYLICLVLETIFTAKILQKEPQD